MSLHVFQWLRDFCASHSHFWAENKPILCCLDGGLHPGEEQSREHPHPSPAWAALLLKVTQTEPPAQQRWQIKVREPKQLLPGLFALLPFRSQPSSSEQSKETKQSRQEQTAVHPLHLPNWSSWFHSWRKGSLKGFQRAEPLCQLQEWQDRAWFGISPLTGFDLLFFNYSPGKGKA